MAKMMGPRFKQCRRLGLNVCGHPKAMDRAVKGTSRADKKLSPYGVQLLEKQRLRAYYGVLEKQFANYVKKAEKSKESTGTALIQALVIVPLSMASIMACRFVPPPDTITTIFNIR